ncbi:ABC transporter substrate-binding protein [Kitasatospora sp. CB02891]|nr:ABC transporter substrate-binding protein [Kitasatospora sp. CB02891]
MPTSNSLGRRGVLQLGAVTGVALSGLAALTGCGAEDSAKSAAGKGISTDRLRVGAADASGSVSIDPRTAGFGASYVILYHLYDSLMYLKGGAYELGLAESVEANRDATEWTIRIRKRATFHDGRPVTAQDVAYSLRTLAVPPSKRATVYADVDVDRIKVLDATTLTVPMRRPRGDFRESVLVVFSPVFPEGTTDFSKGIGSGPYRLAAQDGKNVRMTAYEGYWGGRPAFGTLELVSIADAATRMSALKSGQIDYAMGITATAAKAERDNRAIELHRGGVANSNALSFAMNERIAPFDDPRVRRAVRLAADRGALAANMLDGMGVTGDDVVGKGLPGYAGLAERRRDVAEAKRLFAEAGVSKLTLHAADTVAGFTGAARLLGQQLDEAGVKLTVDVVPADTYYADLKGLSSIPFQTFYYTNRPAAVHLSALTNRDAFFNVTGLADEHWKRLDEAQATVDDKAREQRFVEIQRDLYEHGGDLLWGFQEVVDASVAGVRDVVFSQSIPVFTWAKASS